MKRRQCLQTLVASALLCGSRAPFARAFEKQLEEDKQDPIKLRVLSFNIQIGRGPGGSYSNPQEAFLDKTAAAIKAVAPDVAGLQEVDNKTNRSGADVDQLDVVAKLTDLIPTFSKKIELPGGLYGVGTLSKEKPLKVDAYLMEGSSHTRVLQAIEFERYYFFNTHFPLSAPTRLKAVETIEREASKRTDKPIILVGDLNATPDSEEIQTLKANWFLASPDAPTFPSPAPTVQIDYVFVRNAKKVDVLDARVVEDPSTSDHRPVFCELAIE